jgi:spore coat polysaccharide biosynthesis protein SpsF
MTTVAIVQARMGSTRLPGKVLQDIAGRTMLARVVERASRCRSVDAVVVATTTGAEDDAIVETCRSLGVAVVRGSREDVLDRYYRAAKGRDADPIVRLTSDCPLLDPEVMEEVIALFRKEKPDYASNVTVRTFPQGLDVEVVSLAALTTAWREATEPFERVHVTPFLYRHPERFRLANLTAGGDYSAHRWTVDEPRDLEFVRAIYVRLGADGRFGWRSILDLLWREPELLEINRGVRQKSLEEG